METTKEKQDQSKLTRLDVLRQQLIIQCFCNGQWLDYALERLDKNAISSVVLAGAFITLLVLGRGKSRNVYIIGPAKYDKAVVLDQLRVIFNMWLACIFDIRHHISIYFTFAKYILEVIKSFQSRVSLYIWLL